MHKINLYFWQNCVSPHQLPYIKELYKDTRVDKVFLIVPILELLERKAMGWTSNLSNDGVELIFSPGKDQIEKLFADNQEDSVHFFSGIRADKFVFGCFKQSLSFNIKRGIITEPPFDYKKPLFLHRIRFLLFDYKYISKIDYVFGMGDQAVDYYKFWSKKWKVFLFGYCVDIDSNKKSNNQHDVLRFLYIGSLIKRKNVDLLLRGILNNTNNSEFTLDIIGDGPERDSLIKYIHQNKLSTWITLLGKLSMSEIHQKLADYDVLILPSIHDGWGAVVNEGLHNGLYIILSDHCGAKTLIENSDRGIIFKSKNLVSLSVAINSCIQNADLIKSGKQERILWSQRLDGIEFAKYLVDCIDTMNPIIPPWKKK